MAVATDDWVIQVLKKGGENLDRMLKDANAIVVEQLNEQKEAISHDIEKQLMSGVVHH